MVNLPAQKAARERSAKIVLDAVRDTALDQMCAGLRAVGIPEAKIKEARKQAIEQNSDKPLLALFTRR